MHAFNLGKEIYKSDRIALKINRSIAISTGKAPRGFTID